VLLSRTGTRNFIEFVPWLVLIATIVIVLWPILVRRDEGGSVHPNITMALWPVAIAGIFLVALYGGYFGAGIGILMIGALSFRSWQEHDDARQEHERPWQECDEYWQRSHLQDDYEPECRSPARVLGPVLVDLMGCVPWVMLVVVVAVAGRKKPVKR
jgi:hypothetical protein